MIFMASEIYVKYSPKEKNDLTYFVVIFDTKQWTKTYVNLRIIEK